MINVQWTKFQRKFIATFISEELPYLFSKSLYFVSLRPTVHSCLKIVFGSSRSALWRDRDLPLHILYLWTKKIVVKIKFAAFAKNLNL